MQSMSVIWYTRKEGESDIIRVKSWSWPSHQNISILSLLLLSFFSSSLSRDFASWSLGLEGSFHLTLFALRIFASNSSWDSPSSSTPVVLQQEHGPYFITKAMREIVSLSLLPTKPLNLFLWWHDSFFVIPIHASQGKQRNGFANSITSKYTFRQGQKPRGKERKSVTEKGILG